MPMALPALVTLLAILWYVFTGIQVGRARARHKVYAPATRAIPRFERAFRVQMNELEQIVAFLPAIWLFAWFGNPRFAALAGAVWLVGRVVYAVGYWAEARRRARRLRDLDVRAVDHVGGGPRERRARARIRCLGPRRKRGPAPGVK